MDDQPYIYFSAATYKNATFRPVSGGGGGGSSNQSASSFRPYEWPRSATSGTGAPGGSERQYCSPETFQLISPGLDRRLGTGGTLNSDEIVSSSGGGGAQPISADDIDNKVHFDRRRVGDIRQHR
jgi:hypothetical protein